MSGPALSVVIPVYDEADTIRHLLDEVVSTLRPLITMEIIVVDDASRDGTAAVLAAAARDIPEMTVATHARNQGQSAAIVTGVSIARAAWVATLDGDGQNDPADLPRLMAERAQLPPDCRLVAGWRQQRRDTWSKRLGSRVANAVRGRLLNDGTPDTGCGTKLFERDAFLALPRFRHMHRYLPALFQRDGWRTFSVPVRHRPRTAGASKYSNLQRLWVGLFDLAGVAWLRRRPGPVGEVRVVGPASAIAARNEEAKQ
ncbi:MAG: dolichol-phosphate mannosyltransferase [Lysobacterales bacterium RIFOXYD1_FULL_69_11]|nr:MAG: dolichol-phosphate mannosyltransferase [Xanthomonadales bacterium RIFOXYA1_FULL_69_10]OHE86373.1 MAG: dolichol-phosphate mannosyltransferase [Xanthomonadales bacterium RIFOXYD1_FULL_69_11]